LFPLLVADVLASQLNPGRSGAAVVGGTDL